MTIRFASIIALGCLLSSGCAEQDGYRSGQWIDLSYDLSAESIYWPTAEAFKLETVFSGVADGGYYYSANQFSAAEHGGTHIDAPVHFARGGKTVDEIPLSQLIAPAIKVVVSKKVDGDRDYRVGVGDFDAWEAEHGMIPEASIVLIETGFGQYWPDRVKYLGTDKRGQEGVAELHFPGLHPEAAEWLVKNRKISAVGIDTASIDYGQSKAFESHVILMGQNVPAFENVANLDKVPITGAQIIALPIKIKGGSGGPLRIVALIPISAGPG